MPTKRTLAAVLAQLVAIGLSACSNGGSTGSDAGAQSAAGWCYLTAAAAGSCAQAIAFSPSGAPATGIPVWIACPATVPEGGVGTDAGMLPEFLASLGSDGGGGACLPAKLPTAAGGTTTCVLLEILPGVGGESACAAPGLSAPDADTVATLQARASVASTTPVCQVTQLPASAGGSCASAAQ
jgi:hypothetical protein